MVLAMVRLRGNVEAGGARQRVVFGEIARQGDARSEGSVDALGGVFGDVFVERARAMTAGEDAFDRSRLERAEARRVREGSNDVGGVVARAQEQDLPGVMGPDAGRQGDELGEERGRALAQLGEGLAELVAVDDGLPVGVRVQAERVNLFAATARAQLVAREARDVGAVDEELRLGHAQGEKVGDVVVGDGVAIAEPLDVPVDAAKPIGDAGRVVGMRRQRQKMGGFVAKPIERTLPVTLARVDDAIEPDGELGAEVIAVAKRAAVEKRALMLPKTALGAGLGIGFSADGGAGVCMSQQTSCSQDGDRCDMTSDCCDGTSGVTCINHVCSQPPPR